MAVKCGVCHTADSKYKCPICELRYCSLVCYKTHKATHNAEDGSKARADQTPQVKRDRPGTTQRVPKVDFNGLENDAEFKRLLSRYPLLKTQLQMTYALTLEPGPHDARSWNREPLYGEQRHGYGRGRGRDRGDRGARGRARGRHEQPQPQPQEDRQWGPWTQEKGDKEALTVMKNMRKGGSDDEKAEGMREFVELCQIKFGSSGQSAA